MKSKSISIYLAALVLGTASIRADSPGPAPAAPAAPAGGIAPPRRAWLIAYCVETRFHSLAEVDTLSALSPAEKGFCKERLKILNPLID